MELVQVMCTFLFHTGTWNDMPFVSCLARLDILT